MNTLAYTTKFPKSANNGFSRAFGSNLISSANVSCLNCSIKHKAGGAALLKFLSQFNRVNHISQKSKNFLSTLFGKEKSMSEAVAVRSEWWTVKEAAAAIGAAPWTVRDWARNRPKAFRCCRSANGRLRGMKCIHGADFMRWFQTGQNQVR